MPTFISNGLLYLSSDSSLTINGVTYADEDILTYNTVTGVWTLLFDGSDVGATTDVDALHVESDGSLLLSFDATTTLTGFGAVEDKDIVRFIPMSLGATTAGSFAWVLDGSDVGLDTAGEDIDALARAPDGRLVISSEGNFDAGGVTGTDKHLFVFTDTSLGETTSGSWSVYFDGVDVGLVNASEDIWGIEIAVSGDIYLTTLSTYAVTGLSGDSDDLFTCFPITLGETTSCNFSLYWDGDNYGVGSEWLDALAIVPQGAPTPTPTPVPPTDTATPAGPPTDTPTATNTPVPTGTPTPGDTPTPTPLPTATPTSSSALRIYTSSNGGGTVSGISFADEDVLAFNTVTGVWSMLFDGSDVGATTNVNALHVESDGTLLLSFDGATTLTGLGAVEDEDIVRFIPTALGATTAGSFAWVFDGSDVGLDTADEDIDAIARAPDGRLVVSTDGAFNAGGATGVGHDLFIFTDSSLGATTSGSWAIYFDGSDVGLASSTENIWGAEIISDTGAIHLTTISTYAVTGLSGDSDDFFTCAPGSIGDTTSCTFSLYWDGDAHGVGSEWLDALAISNTPLLVMASAEGATTAEDLGDPVYLPLIQR